MPIYKYKCLECGSSFKVIELQPPGVTEKPCIATDKCPGKGVRVPSRGSFTLKGAGWFKDGY